MRHTRALACGMVAAGTMCCTGLAQIIPPDVVGRLGVHQARQVAPDATGACLFNDAGATFCLVLSELDCMSRGGVFQGPGTTCDEPNQPALLGACCLSSGTCFETQEDACLDAGGVFLGAGTLCAPGLCSGPDADLGACVLPNNCGATFCLELTEADCATFGGTFLGAGTTCGREPNAPTGACCLRDGNCLETTESDCLASCGVFLGPGTACAPGLCGEPNAPGEIGACLIPDPNGTFCVPLTEADCVASGGSFQGPGTTCDEPNLPGACCLADGGCVETTEADCIAMRGIFLGAGTPCGPNVCGEPNAPGDIGACLIDDAGIQTCLELTEAECLAVGGAFQGPGTTCVEPTGACCLPGGSCVQTLEADCVGAGGAYLGDGSVCQPDSCRDPNAPSDTGACLFNDAGGAFCVDLTEADCVAFGGAFQGVGTSCSDLFPPGACVLADGSCIEVSEADCLRAGGTFLGAGSLCPSFRSRAGGAGAAQPTWLIWDIP